MIFAIILMLLSLHGTTEATVSHPLSFDISSCIRNGSNTDDSFERCMQIFREQDSFNYNLFSKYFVKRSSYHAIVEDFGKERKEDLEKTFDEKILPLVSAVEQIQKDVKFLHETINSMKNNIKLLHEPTCKIKEKCPLIQYEGGNSKLKPIFLKGEEKIFSTKEKCIEFCYNIMLNSSNEVCQLERSKQSQFKGVKCRASTVRSKYLNSFPNRYLNENQDTSVEYEIYYDNNGQWLSMTLPSFFYRLDNISRNLNLGTLEPVKYELEMGGKSFQFDCDAGFTNNRFLRLNSKRTISNSVALSRNVSSQFTAMVSGKIESGSGFLLYNTKWYIWISTVSSSLSAKISPGNSKSDLYLPNIDIDLHKWYTVTMRVSETTADIFINNKLETSIVLNEKIHPFDYNFEVADAFDGCIGNVLFIPQALSDEELMHYVQILTDPNF